MNTHSHDAEYTHIPTQWTVAQALKVNANDPTTQMPAIDYDFPTMNESVMIWDSGALRDIDGKTVTFKGWYVLWSLAVDKIDLTNTNIYDEWHSRNNRAYIGYWFSKTGNVSDWQWGGRLLKTTADLRPHEWSGGLVLRDTSVEADQNIVDMFYTSEADAPVNQSVPSVSSGRIYADDNGVWFDGFETSVEMFSADGIHNANADEDQYFYFRDPHVFRDRDGVIKCLYESNVAGMRGKFTIGTEQLGHIPPGYEVGSGAQYGEASIGIAVLKDGAYEAGDFSRENWTQLDPIIVAGGVNDQLERPHVVLCDRLTYVFSISHRSTYSGNLSGPDGVYGWVSANGILGPYIPMNGSGLVLGNPDTAPFQTYSHFVYPDGYVQSFIDTVPAPGMNPNAPKVYRIGGTLAPTVKLVLEGSTSYITGVENYARIHAQGSVGSAADQDTRPVTTA